MVVVLPDTKVELVFKLVHKLQAASSLLHAQCLKLSELRDLEWIVVSTDHSLKTSSICLLFVQTPGLAEIQPSNNFNIEILYHTAHCDVIACLNPTSLQPSPHV